MAGQAETFKKGRKKGKGKKNKKRRGKKNAAKQPDRCTRRCKKRKFREKIYKAKKFDYAIKAKWKESDRDTMGTTIVKVEVVDVIKHGRVPIAIGDANLWSNTSCICPRFRKSREYLILGYEDPVNERILYIKQSLTYTWKNSYLRKIRVWDGPTNTTSTNSGRNRKKDGNNDSSDTGGKKKKKKKKKGKKSQGGSRGEHQGVQQRNRGQVRGDRNKKEKRRRNRLRTPRPPQAEVTQATFFI